MTPEECIGLLKRYAEYDGMGIPKLAGCKEAMRIAAELLEGSSHPSNLDEAAEEQWAAMEYVSNTARESTSVRDWCTIDIVNAFKAGAKWMAGQFVLVGGEPTGWFMANDGSEYATGLDLKEPIKLPVDFYVRKK